MDKTSLFLKSTKTKYLKIEKRLSAGKRQLGRKTRKNNNEKSIEHRTVIIQGGKTQG